MPGFTVQYDLEEGEYRLLGPEGEEGDLVEFGCPATVEAGGKEYIACLDLDDDDEPELAIPVRELGAECSAKLVEVVFEDASGDGDEDTDGDTDDDTESGDADTDVEVEENKG